MLDDGAVECLVNMLSYDELRFKGLAKEAGVEETLEKVEKTGSELVKKKETRILEVLRGNVEEEDEEIGFQKLQGLVDGSHLLNFNMDQTPLCICFLGTTNLQKILTILKEFFRDIFTCLPDKYFDKSNLMHDSINCTQVVETIKETTFTLDDLVLVLDECFLPCNLNSSLGDDACNNDSSSKTSFCISYENNNVVLDSDALMSSIYTSPSNGELLASWIFASEEIAQQSI
ncbi:Ubiquitin carboxyl-terminal hydrolase-related protein [Abeliophyllum distichum]|uniref:Ubiquitin carboxyl-terminal hydrolase-related protein n=1 Tax=Abeliophyllum distichum TaxID=126358 RepID=A0ABD1QHU2_9LAMI